MPTSGKRVATAEVLSRIAGALVESKRRSETGSADASYQRYPHIAAGDGRLWFLTLAFVLGACYVLYRLAQVSVLQ